MRIIALTTLTLLCLLSSPGFFSDGSMASEDTPIMTKEELKNILGNIDVIVIDVRYHTHWDMSDFKIKGAFREELMYVNSWIANYPKKSTIVLY